MTPRTWGYTGGCSAHLTRYGIFWRSDFATTSSPPRSPCTRGSFEAVAAEAVVGDGLRLPHGNGNGWWVIQKKCMVRRYEGNDGCGATLGSPGSDWRPRRPPPLLPLPRYGVLLNQQDQYILKIF